MAEATIEDHKYLLELVENRCAIAYFAVANRNQSLFRALQKYYNTLMMNNDDDEFIDNQNSNKNLKQNFLEEDDKDDNLRMVFNKMVNEYDFMNLVMYPNLQARREFVHDAWIIAMARENDELKKALSKDPFFFLTRTDLLFLLRAHDDNMITHILKRNCMLLIQDDASYKLV